MSDFYSVLKQSIIDRDLRSLAEREEAYVEARKAMRRRLWSYHPPLAEDEIDARIGLFDTAVERIENEVVEVFASLPRASRRKTNPATAALLFGGYDDGAGYDQRADSYGSDRHPPRESDLFAGQTADDSELLDVDADGDAPGSLDARSLAVEAALKAHDDPFDDAATRENEPYPEQPAFREPEPFTADERPPPAKAASAVGATAPARSRPSPSRPATVARRAQAPVPARGRDRQKKAGNRGSHVRLLVAAVAVLAIGLVATVGWLFGPRLLVMVGAGASRPPVVLQTNVPGGISDPDTAVRIPTEDVDINQSFAIFDGTDPTVFQSDPDNPVRFDGESARIATSVSSAGARATIGPGLSSRLAGRTVRVTIDARAARENGAATLRFAYQSGLAISHWQAANLSSQFTQFGLVWRVPTLRTDPSGDAIIIEPGIPGSGTGVEIRSITIDLIRD